MRKAFEAWHESEYGEHVTWANGAPVSHIHDDRWQGWLAAKAQAVPKYHMENIRDALVIACDIKEDEGRFEDSLNYIHQAMIEAQEQDQ